MQVAIYGRLIQAEDIMIIQKLFKLLSASGFELTVYAHYYDLLKEFLTPDRKITVFRTHEDIRNNCDYLISLGGDGTILDTLTLVRNSNIPILGINTGRLGFLASTGKDAIEDAVTALRERTYKIDRRTLIHLDSNKPLFGGVNYALNEFSIHKRDTSSMITIHTFINGELLNSYWADGLIIATPTGSTGYSLSCGGPIIFPSSENFVITPVAPHNLNVRPIIVSNDSVLSFEVEGRNESFLCTLDSRYEAIDSTFQLAVRKEDFTIGLMRIGDENYLNTIRNKLGWGADQRN
ncbi:MAG: NAD kinase [Chitinophagales bacterium]|nr:MAG: NAD kinase [Chitinophagales bacterium]